MSEQVIMDGNLENVYIQAKLLASCFTHEHFNAHTYGESKTVVKHSAVAAEPVGELEKARGAVVEGCDLHDGIKSYICIHIDVQY